MALVAWYPMDEDVKDSSKNELDGTNNGITFVPGKRDNAGQFTRSENDNFSIPNLSSYSAFSFAVWISKDSNPGSTMGFLDLDDSAGSNRIALWHNAAGTPKLEFLLETSSGSQQLTRTVGTSISTWYHLFMIWDGSDIFIYVDNTYDNLTASLDGTLDLSSLTTALIGDLQFASNEWDGQIDDLRIFDHALTEDERYAIFNGDEYVIDGWSYAREFRDGDITQTALYRIRSGDLIFSDDVNDTLVNRIDNGQDVHIYNNHSLVFRGLIENFDFSESKKIDISVIDYSFSLAEDYPTYAAVSETASTIVTNLINTYGGGNFTLNIASTTRVYNKTWKAFSPIEIIQELAINEGYTFFVTQQREFNFQPQTYNDLGVTLVDGDTIFKRKFPHDTTKLKNIILVIGKGATDTAGVRARVRDPVSIKKYKPRTKRIEDTSIVTEDEAIIRAESELLRLANPLVIGEVLCARNFSYTAGSVIRITIPQKQWVAKQFLIIEAKSELETPVMSLFLAEINPLNSDQLAELLFKQRIISKNWEDDNVPTSQVELWRETVIAEVYLYVETQSTVTSRDWNENEWNDNTDWDFIPGTWTIIINGEKMVLTNIGLNRIRDLYVGKAVTPMNAANSYIAIGTGTTPETINDTILETESYRNVMDSGFPRDGTNPGENEHQASWNDGDFSSGVFSELGILDNSSGGDLMARIVPATTFSKSVNENLRGRTFTKIIQ